MKIKHFDFEILWMPCQPIVQWNYVIYFHIRGSVFNNFQDQFLEKSS